LTCDECKNEQRILALEKDSERNTSAHKDFYGRFEESSVNYARTDEKYINILDAINKVKEQVAELVAKPTKRWDAIIAAIIAAAVGGFVGHFIQ